ncbi:MULTISPECIES: SDR family oxidoreductase [unclassified Streptomyces]|uniref:SDR family oxidoreductase n=1 Tax=unclassified Streptomyces TaxID=2593676 RepID=UPI0005F948DA|nr:MULTISPECIES: SDR family oxidoreductase [unclassified Streptomyces]KJY30845.1 LysR family transcriptional regulator [Streptomyces sp. NRRL S-495]KOV35270.1 LysR family transcriptional regulator [Streptomyces sp. XY431]
MKITVIGTGLIGSQLAAELTARGHEVTTASLSSGVDLLTGSGLDGALAGAEAAVNVTNSPTFDEQSIAFFRTTVGNLLAAGERAGVRHQVALSIVGVDLVPDLAYYRAKTLQEELLRGGATPWSIVRATQFFEFMEPTMSWTSDEDAVRLPATPIQPIASADVVTALADVATGAPLGGSLDVAGPDRFTLDEIGRLTLAARGDRRPVLVDDRAGLFAAVPGDVLTPGPGARLAPTHYRDWLAAAR